MDYLNKLKNFLSGKKAPVQQVQPTQSFGNNLMVKLGQSPVGRGLVNTQRFMESPRPIQLPQVPQMMNPTVKVGIPNTRFQVPVQPVSFARDIVNEPIKWTANTLSDASVNLGRTIRGDNLSNYQNLKSPVTKLGYQVGGAMLPQNVQGLNVDNRTQEWLGNIGGTVAGPLSVYGGGKAKNVIFNKTVKEGLKKSIIKGGLEGMKIGGGYGIASGLDTNRNESLPQQLLNTAVSGGVGAGLGGVLGGAVGGVGSLKGLTKVAPEVQAQLRDAKGRWVAGEKPVKPPKMPQAQWEFQLNFNQKYKRNPYEPVYSSDLNRAVAYEAEKKGVGLSIRDVSKDRNPLGKPNVSNAGLKEPYGSISPTSNGKFVAYDPVRKERLYVPGKGATIKYFDTEAEAQKALDKLQASKPTVANAGLYDTKDLVFKPLKNPKVGDTAFSLKDHRAIFKIEQIKGDKAIIRQIDNKGIKKPNELIHEVPLKELSSDYIEPTRMARNLAEKEAKAMFSGQSRVAPTSQTAGLYDTTAIPNEVLMNFNDTAIKNNVGFKKILSDPSVNKAYGKYLKALEEVAQKEARLKGTPSMMSAGKSGYNYQKTNSLIDSFHNASSNLASARSRLELSLERFTNRVPPNQELNPTSPTFNTTEPLAISRRRTSSIAAPSTSKSIHIKDVQNTKGVPRAETNLPKSQIKSVNQNTSNQMGQVSFNDLKEGQLRSLSGTQKPTPNIIPQSRVAQQPRLTGEEFLARSKSPEGIRERITTMKSQIKSQEENIRKGFLSKSEDNGFIATKKKQIAELEKQLSVAQQPKGVTNKVGQNQKSPITQVQQPNPQGQVNQLADNVSNEASPLTYGRQAPKPEQAPLPVQSAPLDQSLNTPLPETMLKQDLSQTGLKGAGSLFQRKQPLQQGQSSLRGQSDPFDSIISEAKKEISSGKPKIDKRSLRELADDIYSQWVDRFHPITKAVGQVEKAVKNQGAELRPEVNPRFTIKRYLGAGGIAENKFNNEFKPILKEIDDLKIDKGDLDVYLKNRRDVGFGAVGREIKGSDPVKAQGVVSAIEAKYGEAVKGVADKLYNYQNKMFDELVEAGFIDEKNSKLIRTQNPDYVPFFRDMESQIENYLGMPSNKLQQAKNPLSKIEGSDKKVLSPVESIIANTFKYRAAIEKNNVAKSIVGLQRAMPELGFKKVSQSGTDTITVWDNGQKSFYQVGDDIAETVKGLNEEQMNSVFKLLTIPSSILRQGATGRNPAFMLPNMVRDQLDAALNSKYGYVPFVDYAKGLSHLLKKDEVYQAWQKSGAQISLSDLSGRKGISELFQEKQGKKKFYNWVGRGLDVAGQLSEQPTRIGLFNKAYQKTKNPLIGAMEAREGTLDFARMGSKMKVANSLIPFLNVGIQGFDKMARTAKANPAKFALKMGAYGALPTITTTLWNINNFPEEYKEVPQYEKNGNFVIVTGRTDKGTVQYFTIPKGNVIQYISNPIENFMSYMTETNPQSIKEMTLQFLSSGAPVIGDGSSFSEIGLKTIGSNLPQVIKPSAENLMNKSFFKFDPKKGESKAIVPSYLQNKADGDQSYEFTPSAYKTIGKALNISPLKVQNFLEGHLAGYVKEPISIYETMKGIVDGDGVDRDKAFMIRRFLKETYPTSESKSSTGSGVKRELARAEETSMLSGAEASGFKNPFKKKEQPKPTGNEKITEVTWESDAGRKTTVKLNEKPVKGTGIDAFNKENPDLTNARKIYGAPKDQVSSKDKEAIYKQLGFTREQLDYDYKSGSKFNTDERVSYIQSKSPSHEKLIANLTTGREMSVGGNRFATDAVIDQLYKDDLISNAERKQLKALKPEKKNQGPVVGTKAKKLKVKFPTIKPPKIGSTKTRKSVFKAPKVAKPKVEKIVFKKKKKTSL